MLPRIGGSVDPWQQKAETWRKSWMAERQRLQQMEKTFWLLKERENNFYSRVIMLERFLISEGYRKINDSTRTKEPLFHGE